MANMFQMNATEARGKVFASLVLKEGTLKRGILISRMHVSEGLFAREYMSFLESYPTIKYNRQNRTFTYEP
jgi:hypothetical protein